MQLKYGTSGNLQREFYQICDCDLFVLPLSSTTFAIIVPFCVNYKIMSMYEVFIHCTYVFMYITFMDHITACPFELMEVAHIKSSPIFWLELFPTIVKIFSGFRHLTKKIGFQPRSKIGPCNITGTLYHERPLSNIRSRIKRRLNLVLIFVANLYFNIHANFIDLPNYEQLSQEVTVMEKASIPTFWTD